MDEGSRGGGGGGVVNRGKKGMAGIRQDDMTRLTAKIFQPTDEDRCTRVTVFIIK